MPLSSRARQINPRLGIYFGIFSSLFMAVLLLTLILEQLGIPDSFLRASMLLAPIFMVLVIGLACRTKEPLEYFAAGRRVPSVYCGLGLAITAFGATGLVSMAGIIFVIGFDALCIINAGLAGFVVMAILLAPFFRKFGTFTIPTYLGRRFGSHVLRVTAGALLAVPTLLILVAELQVGLKVAGWLSGQPTAVLVPILVGVIIAGVVLGGVRSLTWTNVASAIVVLIALLIPVAIIAVLLGYLPIAQLSQGPVMREIGRLEAVQAFPIVIQSGFTFELPSEGLHSLTRRFSEPFGSISPLAFVLTTITIFTGIASAPWLLPRLATTPSVYASRKTLGWATFFFALAMLTVATVAVYMRLILFEAIISNIAMAPDWLKSLVTQGFARVQESGARLTSQAISMDRDSILMSLPIAAELPLSFAYLAAVGILLAAFATATATLTTLANLMSEDIVSGLNWRPAKDGVRIGTNQVLLIAGAVFAGIIVLIAPTDPLKLLLWSLTLTGSTAFPVLIASIWWKRVNKFGAFSGIVTGFAITVLVIVTSQSGGGVIDGVLAGVIALPLATLAMIAVSLATVSPTRETMEVLRDIRVPGGEVVHDREVRLMKLKDRSRPKTTSS